MVIDPVARKSMCMADPEVSPEAIRKVQTMHIRKCCKIVALPFISGC